uniref:Integrase catalytic domain-containing protein n=1 Tax=Tanacetum cinerariifolium TaxID=118510 RepID=A0A6L2JW93_TANCI|nr:hypothetical protein [Tanacetum cinerariifolium]
MGKTIGELHALLIEYEKCLPKKAVTPQVMAIQGGRIQKANKKSHNAKGKVLQSLKGARKLKQGDLYLYVGNGVRAQVEAIGSFDLVLPNGLVICLGKCHYAPFITRGVVSVSRLVENRFVQCFMDFGISVSRNNVLYFNAIPSNGIYEINMSNHVLNHYRLAHISKKRIEKMQQDGLLKSTDDESFDQYVSCLSSKMTRKSFPHRLERASDVLGLIHIDVFGPLRHVLRQGASYFITFTDDYSRYGYIYLLKHKHKVFETFKVFKNEVENQLEKIIKALRSDRGGEYISQEFKDYLKAYGIVQQLTPPYTPQHNRVSERRNHTLLDMVRSMMNLTNLPLSFWDYALEAVARILNLVPTKKVDKTAYELWFGKVSNLSYLEVWGCEALMKQDTPEKLQQRSVKCIFIGYPKETMGYYFYFLPKNKIVVARYAKFFEKNILSQEVSGRVGDLEEIQDEDTSPSKITSDIPMEVEGFEPPQEEEAPVCRSERPHRAPNRLCLNVEVKEHSLRDLNKPANYKAAMLDPESNKWLDAINAEMQSLKDNQVWRLVDLPPNGIYSNLRVDYEETFSPVADIRAIRILIAIVAFYDYEIWQMDVKTAFLNGYLNEDIYMMQPEGFIDPKHPRKVYKLQRSIYGLKQASRSWNKRFDEEIKILQSVKTYLGKCFAMKDLGEAAFILGIKIYRDRSRRLIGLCQSAYMDKTLKIYRMDNSKRGYIPMKESLDLNKTQGTLTPGEVKRMQNVRYASVNPDELYWTAVKTILKYLRNTKDMYLVYGRNPEAELRVECYYDAGFKTDRYDTKSQT